MTQLNQLDQLEFEKREIHLPQKTLDRFSHLASAAHKLFDPSEDFINAGERLSIGGNLSKLSNEELIVLQNQITQILLGRMGAPRE